MKDERWYPKEPTDIQGCTLCRLDTTIVLLTPVGPMTLTTLRVVQLPASGTALVLSIPTRASLSSMGPLLLML